MTKSIEQLRRDAKALKKAFELDQLSAKQRIANHPPRPKDTLLKLADFLHVIARENSFESWPALKLAAELHGLDRAGRIQRLKIAVSHGQNQVVDRLLSETPDLPKDQFGLQIALYRREAVANILASDPDAATRIYASRKAMCHLAFSKYIHARPDLEGDMLAIADLLVRHGASVDDVMPVAPDNDHQLSALYGAIGHANNMTLGRWLLEHGANPNDGESLYHATELGHSDGLELLLKHGANPKGTNALLRAIDFNDHQAVQLLLDAGANADEFDGTHVGGERPWVVPALHQAARRMCDSDMIELLLDAGANPARQFEGCSTYGYARVFGNQDLVRAIEARADTTELTTEEALMAQAAAGEDTNGLHLDPEQLPEAYRNIIRTILHLPGKLDHIKRLVDIGLEFDHPDTEGLTPVQAAGWEGMPETMEYLLGLGPDLTHQNGYGGTLLSTIIHGSENCPQRMERDHVTCIILALNAGVPVPRQAADFAGVPEIAELLFDWCEAHPDRVTDGGAV